MGGVVGGVVFFHYYQRVDEEIRSCIEARLVRHYGAQGLKVRVRSAQRVEGRGIRVRDLSITDPGVGGSGSELLRVEEALFECSTDWQDLLGGNPPVHRVVIRRPTLHASRRADGAWSTGKLLPLPHFGEHPPQVVVQGGVVEIGAASATAGNGVSETPARVLTLRDVNLTIAAAANSSVAKQSPSSAANRASEPRQLQGTAFSDFFRRMEIDGAIDARASTFSIRGRVEGMEISPELRDTLPVETASQLSSLGNFWGRGDFQFEIRHDPSAIVPLKFDVSGRIAQGRIDDPRLPHAVSELRADVHVDNGGATIDNLRARLGQSELRVSCRRTGLSADSPLWLTAEVRQLELDRELLKALPSSLQDVWSKYLPAGRIDANIRLDYDGRAWRPEITAQCLDVSFTHHKFPYRLEHGRGTIELKDDRLTLNMTAQGGSRPVRLSADLRHPLSGATGWFEVKGDEIPLDETLFAAMPEKPREVVHSLDPRGTANFYMRLWRDRPEESLHQHLRVDLNRCVVRYEKFSYPVTNVRGVLEMFDGNWTFRDLDGSNGTARITCEGRLTHGLQGAELTLNVTGCDVPLEEELRGALNPSIQQVWLDLQPRGIVDLTAEIRYLVETRQFNVSVRVQPQPQTASIEPVRFPYRLDRVEGAFLYRDGHVTFDRCKAEHGPVKVASQGSCDFLPDGRWRMNFENLTVDRLRADRELVQSLPERLKQAVVELNPTGAMNLSGQLSVERNERIEARPRWRWNMQIGMQQGSLQCGSLLLENIWGTALFSGGFDGVSIRSHGELSLNSLRYKDCQLTQVTGPIWIGDDRVLFGTWAEQQKDPVAAGSTNATVVAKKTPRSVTAGLFGGTLYGNGWVMLEREARYGINATLVGADLSRCAQEVIAGQQRLRGKITASADIAGRGRTRNNLSGRGKIQLSGGDVYELPVMVSLLKILSIRVPNQNAFSDATVDYRIEGEHIYFDRIDFRGDAISLRGQGEMDFQTAIRMTFYTLVGRGDLEVPIVNQVFRGASQQLMLIHVDGTLQDPRMRKEALPAVNQALQQIREELQKR